MVQYADESFWKFPHELLNEKGVTKTMERIYVALLDMRKTVDEAITISTNHLANKVSCCPKSVINAVKRLIEMGRLQKKEKKSRTEINSFFVISSLPIGKKRKSVPKEQPAPSAEPEQIQPKSEKPKKKKYGEHGRVRLTDEEYSSLIADFGQEKVAEYIQKVDDYSKDKNRWYSNNAETIRKWLEEDKNKPNKGKDNWGGYRPQKMEPGKTYYNFHGKTYRDLIEELPEEQQAQWYQRIYPSQLDEVATMPLDKLADLNKYDDLVNLFEDAPVPPPKPEPEEEPPKPPSNYEMTNEEIKEILENWNCKVILENRNHPLFQCTPGDLISLAEKWKAYKGL